MQMRNADRFLQPPHCCGVGLAFLPSSASQETRPKGPGEHLVVGRGASNQGHVEQKLDNRRKEGKMGLGGLRAKNGRMSAA